DLVAFVLDQSFADLSSDIVESVVPRDLLPFPVTATSFSPHREKNAVLIIDLIDRRRALCTISPATAGMIRIPLKLSDPLRLFIDICQQPAPRFAVEAGG